MQSARIAIRNIARQKKRTILLGGAIAFGVLTIILIGSFTSGVLENVRENFTGIFGGHIYISGQELSPTERILSRIGDTEILDKELASFEEDIAGIHVRSRARGDAIFGSRQESISLEGVDWQAEPTLWDDLGIIEGDPGLLSQEDFIILPESVASALDVEVGEAVLFRLNTVSGQANVGEFTLAGLYRNNQSFNISGGYADLSFLNSLIGLEADEFQFLNITLHELGRIDAVAGALYRQLQLAGEVEPRGDEAENEGMRGGMMSLMGGGAASLADDEEPWEGTKFTITTLNDMMDPILSLVRVLDLIRTGLFVILLLITMVGLLNTFRMILIERTQEIGTMRAIGMQRIGVRNIFLWEALFLALFGAVAGLLIALGLMGTLSSIHLNTDNVLQLFTRNGQFAFPFVWDDVATTVLLLSGITLISAWLPARKAAKLKPADALRISY